MLFIGGDGEMDVGSVESGVNCEQILALRESRIQ
jgi:hypothetical protein